MESFLKDVRFGIRMLARTPLLSATAALTFGLGLGATTFIYSVSFVFWLLPVQDADQLMMVRRNASFGGGAVPFHDYRDFRERQSTFRDLAAGYTGTFNLAGHDGPPERVRGSYVTANAFEGMGISPILGRAFQEGDDAPGAPALLLLGFQSWQNHYAGDPDVLGRTARVNGEPATIVGVMPEGFGFPVADAAWAPLRYDPATLGRGGGRRLWVWGYLRDGIDQGSATADLQAIARQLEAEFPERNEGVGARAVPYVEAVMPGLAYELGAVLMAMGLGVLIVACANVANLLLARATVREKDVAIRSALGARRSHVIRQLLVETVVVAAVGGLLALIFVQLAFPWYEGVIAVMEKPYWFIYSIKPRVLLFTAGVTLSAALLAGTIPAVRASGAGIGTVLRREGAGASSIRVGRFGRGLVVVELAVCCALLIGAGLLQRSVMELNRTDLGFDVDPVLTAAVEPPPLDYPDADTRNQLFRSLLEETRSIPGTEAAALTNSLPGVDQLLTGFRVEGVSYSLDTDVPSAGIVTASPGYFETFGIELELGRDFLSSESIRGGEPVVIVNRAFADRHLGGNDAMGRRIRLGTADRPSAPWIRIVGVVSNAHQGIMTIFSGQPHKPEAIYLSLGSSDPRLMYVVVRQRGAPERFVPELREAAARIDPNLPLFSVQPMQVWVELGQFIHRYTGILVTYISLAGLFLAVVGLYGVMDFSVSSRLREMGIRIAIGASRWRILGLVFRRVFLQVGLGATLGLVLGFALGKPLSATLLGVESWDTTVAMTVVLILGVTGCAAALPPALKALRVDPVEAVRAE